MNKKATTINLVIQSAYENDADFKILIKTGSAEELALIYNNPSTRPACPCRCRALLKALTKKARKERRRMGK